ncbi:HpcH/HpaI aldolase family protein [Jannaschia aquimarina]|uniref:HpcH protein n=1 Tax=Jannaschia aquimarina TaxID=935700 RepID=A0A0D1EK21_9RHOB|nr:aldolase/citrate lyase family protein [Jannaschia aquimarina]KIT17346.1 4-hydroxy-2-oxo-heptane-1,7-dioate aldolase [Jannaschia aquimarina]SNT20664.1 2,4-dihydroxyhept-2-enedioate aldolase [Jannaschia aquimarina]
MSLKSRVLAREPLTGLWQVLPGPVAAEIAARAGFDFLVLDGEHGPWDPSDLRARLIAVPDAIVRVPANDPVWIKQALDLGAMTVLVPMVHDAEGARAAVAAARYPPDGIRGHGAFVSRASAYGQNAGYVTRANEAVGVWVQAESRPALSDLEAICGVEGVDCVFIGPADLAADMGLTPDAPEVLTAIEDAIGRIVATGTACGAFGDPALYPRWRELGATILSAGVDGSVLAAALARLAP